MAKAIYLAEDEVVQPKSTHRTANMIAFDGIVMPLVTGEEEVIQLTPEGDESPRGLRLSIHRAATRCGIKIVAWEAPGKIVYAKIKHATDEDVA